jgi:hypothetical protein
MDLIRRIVMKNMKQVKLFAVLENGEKVSSSNWQERVKLTDEDGYFHVFPEKDSCKLTTKKGTYTLKKHPTQNHYHNQLNNFKVQIIVKKMVGTLIYWA